MSRERALTSRGGLKRAKRETAMVEVGSSTEFRFIWALGETFCVEGKEERLTLAVAEDLTAITTTILSIFFTS